VAIAFAKSVGELYIHTSINNDGAGCLNLRCPNVDPRCRAVVSEDMVFSLGLSEEDNSKYRTYLVRSYVEQKK
jgi:ariadne-1